MEGVCGNTPCSDVALSHHINENCRAPVLDATRPSSPGEKRRIQINKIISERGDVTTDTTEIQKLVRDC